MLRTNETSRVGAVLEHARAGDRAAMIQAAVELWLSPPEGDPERDLAHAEVWTTITAAGAIDDAVAAVLTAIRDGQQVRPRTFVDVSEAITDSAVHRELVERVVATSWDPTWYLAAALMRLVDARQERVAWELVDKHRERIFRDDAAWRAVGVLLTTTRVGDRSDLDGWFEDWTRRRDVPMWLLHTYGSTLLAWPHTLRQLTQLSELALQHATRDVTAGWFEAYIAVDHLREGRFEAFREKMWELEPELAELLELPILDHPATRFLNRVKHAHPIVDDDVELDHGDVSLILLGGLLPIVGIPLTVTAATRAIANARNPAVHNPRTGEQLAGVHTYTARLATVLRVFTKMWDLERGDPRVVEFCKAMAKSHPSELPWLQPTWARLVRQRTSWTTRVKLALF